jgi:hypothetical protein
MDCRFSSIGANARGGLRCPRAVTRTFLPTLKDAGLSSTSPNFKHEVEHSARLGDCAWFTDNEDVAWGYMDDSDDGEVMMCFLSLQNPLDLRVSAIGAERALQILREIYKRRYRDVTEHRVRRHQPLP